MRTKRKVSALLVAGAMLFSLCAPFAFAEEGAGEVKDTGPAANTFALARAGDTYLDENGVVQTVPGGVTEVTDRTTSLGDGWYIVRGTVTVDNINATPIDVTGDTNLILGDSYTLKVPGGIIVNDGASLTVYAQSDEGDMGTLEAGGMSAGITCNNGTLVINGGNIVATSYGNVSIGGSGGTITIYGGTVNQKTPDSEKKGIGGTGFDITINGGTVEADSSSNDEAAGISGDSITITGGTVNAMGGKNAAGIGGGNNEAGGTITISGGTVTATGGENAAGIGGGNGGAGGSITITGGTVTANGGKNGAGIGGGANGNSGTITIDGETDTTVVEATGGENGAGIGGGNLGHGEMITIDGGTVTTIGGSPKSGQRGGAGIGGGGNDGSGVAGNGGNGGKITINGGHVVATCKDTGVAAYSAAIGGGAYGDGGIITITGGTVVANGGAGNYGAAIGGGAQNGATITIVGGDVTATGSARGAGIGGGMGGDGGTITIEGADTIVNATGGEFGAAGIGGGLMGNGVEITINGGDVTAIGGNGDPTKKGDGGGAGIGGGRRSTGTGASGGASGKITITGGTVKATGGTVVLLDDTQKEAADIGRGVDAAAPAGDDFIKVSDGVTVTGIDQLVHGYDPSVNRWASTGDTQHVRACRVAGCTDTAHYSTEGTAHTYPEPPEVACEQDQTCTDCGYTKKLEHVWATGWNSDATNHWHECENAKCPITNNDKKDGYAAHTGGTATCKAPASCDICGKPYGDINPNNHTGDVELRGYKAPTATKEGYSGDRHCSSCGVMLEQGHTLPKTGGGDTPGSSSSSSSSSGSSSSDSSSSSSSSGSSSGSSSSNSSSSTGGWGGGSDDGSSSGGSTTSAIVEEDNPNTGIPLTGGGNVVALAMAVALATLAVYAIRWEKE